jgi:AcrR family transcriptional regulator
MSAAKQPKTRVRMQPDERRERIVQTALGFFARDGYAASMGELADAAGVTRSAL